MSFRGEALVGGFETRPCADVAVARSGAAAGPEVSAGEQGSGGEGEGDEDPDGPAPVRAVAGSDFGQVIGRGGGGRRRLGEQLFWNDGRAVIDCCEQHLPHDTVAVAVRVDAVGGDPMGSAAPKGRETLGLWALR